VYQSDIAQDYGDETFAVQHPGPEDHPESDDEQNAVPLKRRVSADRLSDAPAALGASQAVPVSAHVRRGSQVLGEEFDGFEPDFPLADNSMHSLSVSAAGRAAAAAEQQFHDLAAAANLDLDHSVQYEPSEDDVHGDADVADFGADHQGHENDPYGRSAPAFYEEQTGAHFPESADRPPPTSSAKSPGG